MPDIRYVCLSDMHLGADNSVLTAIKPGSIETDTSQASVVLSQLVRCLREIIARNEGAEKPTLVLNGDILEMALTDESEEHTSELQSHLNLVCRLLLEK